MKIKEMMIPYEQRMGTNFVPYDTLEWLESQANQPNRQVSLNGELSIAEKIILAGISPPSLPGTYLLPYF